MRDKSINKIVYKIFTIVLIVLVLISLTSCSIIGILKDKKDNNTVNSNFDTRLAEQVRNAIEQNYYRHLSPQDIAKINESMADSVISSLDKYGRLTKKTNSLFSSIIEESKAYKVGITIKINDYNDLYINSFTDIEKIKNNTIELDSNLNPKAVQTNKLKRGNVLIALKRASEVNFVRVQGLNMIQFNLVSNPIFDFSKEIEYDFKILDQTDETIKYFRVKSQIFDPKYYSEIEYELIKLKEDVAMIEFTEFNIVNLRKFLIKLNKFNKSSNYKNLVLDLRSNPGGDLNVLLTVLYYLYGNSDVNFMQFRNYNKNRITDINVKNGKLDVSKIILGEDDEYATELKLLKPLAETKKDYKLVVLVNSNSASASEAFTGASLNNKVSKGHFIALIGTKTYGKGVAQTNIDINSEYELHITTDEYFVANNSGEWIKVDGIGFSPSPDNIVGAYNGYGVNEDIKEDPYIKKALEKF